VFSHPLSFQLELKALVRGLPDLEHRYIKAIGLSRNWPEDNTYWNRALQPYDREGKNVEIVSRFSSAIEKLIKNIQVDDEQGEISRLYGMLSEYDSKGVVTIVSPYKVLSFRIFKYLKPGQHRGSY
jgi:hypothetical protein